MTKSNFGRTFGNLDCLVIAGSGELVILIEEYYSDYPISMLHLHLLTDL